MIRPLADITSRLIHSLERPAPLFTKPLDKKKPRGVALLMVLVTIAILSVVVVEFLYESRVNMALASNQREKLKSHYLAKSSFNLSKLLISFHFALQNESKQTDDQLGKLIGRAMSRSNFQMYQYIDLLLGPFNSGQIESPIGGINLNESGVQGFGGFVGEMVSDVRPEEGKININDFATESVKENALQQLCALILDSQYDPIFELKDENGELMDRAALVGRIVDFLDFDQEGTAISDTCTIEGRSGDETRPYDSRLIQPRNRKFTHIDELHQVAGMNDAFMNAFKHQFTVYPIGKPNINVTDAIMFYSILCRNVEIKGVKGAASIDACRLDPNIANQVLWLAMSLEGIKSFFENPLTVLMAYVGTSNGKLLPSAKKGQPGAFLNVSQFPKYIEDLRKDPLLMAQFIQHSPLYQRLSLANPEMAIDPIEPKFIPFTVAFKKSGLMKAVTVKTPKVYRIFSTGKYGSTETTIEAVLDFGRPVRRIPSEALLLNDESDDERIEELKAARQETLEEIPTGRIMFWQEL